MSRRRELAVAAPIVEHGRVTIVFLHAHPDDEATSTAGSMVLASRAGHRVVVVYGTNGDHGEGGDSLPEGTALVEHRRGEAEASARVTGTARVSWLGYSDSGMTGWEQNAHEGSFHAVDVDEAAGRLAAILDEEDADVLVGYDWHGGYGHPDHVKVHHVAHRAAELAARRPRLLESTSNRDYMRHLFAMAAEMGLGDQGWDVDGPADDGNPFGTPEAEIHWRVDVTEVIGDKRRALECHASQTSDVGMILGLPEEAFVAGFGYEFYIEPGAPAGMRDGFPFDTV